MADKTDPLGLFGPPAKKLVTPAPDDPLGIFSDGAVSPPPKPKPSTPVTGPITTPQKTPGAGRRFLDFMGRDRSGPFRSALHSAHEALTYGAPLEDVTPEQPLVPDAPVAGGTLRPGAADAYRTRPMAPVVVNSGPGAGRPNTIQSAIAQVLTQSRAGVDTPLTDVHPLAPDEDETTKILARINARANATTDPNEKARLIRVARQAQRQIELTRAAGGGDTDVGMRAANALKGLTLGVVRPRSQIEAEEALRRDAEAGRAVTPEELRDAAGDETAPLRRFTPEPGLADEYISLASSLPAFELGEAGLTKGLEGAGTAIQAVTRGRKLAGIGDALSGALKFGHAPYSAETDLGEAAQRVAKGAIKGQGGMALLTASDAIQHGDDPIEAMRRGIIPAAELGVGFEVGLGGAPIGRGGRDYMQTGARMFEGSHLDDLTRPEFNRGDLPTPDKTPLDDKMPEARDRIARALDQHLANERTPITQYGTGDLETSGFYRDPLRPEVETTRTPGDIPESGYHATPGYPGAEATTDLGDLERSGFHEKPETGVVLPQGEAGRMGTVDAVKRARELVGDDEFQRRVKAAIDERDSQNPLVRAAAVEETARQITSEGEQPLVDRFDMSKNMERIRAEQDAEAERTRVEQERAAQQPQPTFKDQLRQAGEGDAVQRMKDSDLLAYARRVARHASDMGDELRTKVMEEVRGRGLENKLGTAALALGVGGAAAATSDPEKRKALGLAALALGTHEVGGEGGAEEAVHPERPFYSRLERAVESKPWKGAIPVDDILNRFKSGPFSREEFNAVLLPALEQIKEKARSGDPGESHQLLRGDKVIAEGTRKSVADWQRELESEPGAEPGPYSIVPVRGHGGKLTHDDVMAILRENAINLGDVRATKTGQDIEVGADDTPPPPPARARGNGYVLADDDPQGPFPPNYEPETVAVREARQEEIREAQAQVDEAENRLGRARGDLETWADNAGVSYGVLHRALDDASDGESFDTEKARDRLMEDVDTSLNLPSPNYLSGNYRIEKSGRGYRLFDRNGTFEKKAKSQYEAYAEYYRLPQSDDAPGNFLDLMDDIGKVKREKGEYRVYDKNDRYLYGSGETRDEAIQDYVNGNFESDEDHYDQLMTDLNDYAEKYAEYHEVESQTYMLREESDEEDSDFVERLEEARTNDQRVADEYADEQRMAYEETPQLAAPEPEPEPEPVAPPPKLKANARTKFDSYQRVPGGKNYREIRITWDNKATPTGPRLATPEEAADYYSMSLSSWMSQSAEERANDLRYVGEYLSKDTPGNYTEGHWDEPNVIAHVRMDEHDYTPALDPETASDPELAEIVKRRDALGAEQGKVAAEYNRLTHEGVDDSDPRMQEIGAKYQEINARVVELEEEYNSVLDRATERYAARLGAVKTEKVLDAFEHQSDWKQMGESRGFADEQTPEAKQKVNDEIARLTAEKEKLITEQNDSNERIKAKYYDELTAAHTKYKEMHAKRYTADHATPAWAEYYAEEMRLKDEYKAIDEKMTAEQDEADEQSGLPAKIDELSDRIRAQQDKLSTNPVAAMPWKENSAVFGLTSARSLIEAAEGDYDRLAWSTSENRVKLAHLSPEAAKITYDQSVTSGIRKLLKGLGFDPKIEKIVLDGYDHWSVKLTPEMKARIKKTGFPALGVLALVGASRSKDKKLSRTLAMAAMAGITHDVSRDEGAVSERPVKAKESKGFNLYSTPIVPAVQAAFDAVAHGIDFHGTIAEAVRTKRRGLSSVVDRVFDALANSYGPIERLGAKSSLRPSENPNQLLSYVKSSDETVRRALREGVLDPVTREVVGPSFESVFEPLGKDEKKLKLGITYIVAKRSVGRGLDAVGGDQAVFDNMKKVVEHGDADPALREFATRWEKYTDAIGNYAVGTGLWTPQMWKAMKASDVLFVHFQRIMDEGVPARGKGHAGGRALGNVTPGVKKFVGSRRALANPVESMGDYTRQIIHRADRYRIGHAVMDAIDDIPGGELIGTPVRDPSAGVKASAVNMVKAQQLHLPPEVVAEIERLFDPKLDARNPVLWRNNAHTGGRDYMTIHAPELWKSVMQLNSSDESAVRKFLDVTIRPLKRVFTATTTGWSPRFSIATNPGRDIPVAFAQSKANIRPDDIAVGYAHGILDLFGKSELADEASRFGLTGVSNFAQDRPKATARRVAPLTRADRVKNRIRGTLTSPVHVLEAAGSASDLGPRLGEYMAAMRKNMKKVESGEWTLEDARLDAATKGRQVTLDFSNRPGNPVLKMFADYIPFFGVGLNGPTKMVISGIENPRRVAAVSGAVAAAATLAWVMKHRAGQAMIDRINDRDPGERSGFIYVPTAKDGPILRVPLSQELGVVANGVTAALDKFYEDDPSAGKLMASTLARLIPSGMDAALQGVIPIPGVQQIQENARNRKVFGNRPVESRRLEDLPPEERRYPTTSPTFDLLAAGARKAGVSDATPLGAENVVRGVASQATPYLTAVTDPIASRIMGRKANKPVPTAVARNPLNPMSAVVAAEPPAVTATEQRYYALKDKMKEAGALKHDIIKGGRAHDTSEVNRFKRNYGAVSGSGLADYVDGVDNMLKSSRERELKVRAGFEKGTIDGETARKKLDALVAARQERLRFAVRRIERVLNKPSPTPR